MTAGFGHFTDAQLHAVAARLEAQASELQHARGEIGRRIRDEVAGRLDLARLEIERRRTCEAQTAR